MRVILGRRIGYEGLDYSVEEVHNLTIAHNCGDLALTEADLFSLRYVDELREYHEPGVIAEGNANNLERLLYVAERMGQERLVAEMTGIETQVYQQSARG